MKKGYKGFKVNNNNELYCRDMVFEVGKIYTIKGEPVICERGFHFCWNLNQVDNYYDLRNSVICEVEPLGDIVADAIAEKCCTNKIKILRMLTKEEVLRISSMGQCNTGYCNMGNYNIGDWNIGNYNMGNYNTGNYNTGDYNTGSHNRGNWNTGYRNTGSYNTGNNNRGNWNTGAYNTSDYNTGDCNTGDYNTGDYNTGDYNTGFFNTGNYNTGDYNTGDYNTGFFNIKTNRCFIFDKLSDMTCREFINSKYYKALISSRFPLTEWICYTPEEKANDKAKELIGGYLKQRTFEEAAKIWWGNISEENKKIIMQIPNFDAKKFKKITGIDVKAKG